MKTLCDHSKKLPDNLLLFVEQTQNAKFICGKCGRPTSTKDMVCKPNKISKLKDEE